MVERIGRIQFNMGDPEPKPEEPESRVRINMGDSEPPRSRVETGLNTTSPEAPELPKEHSSGRVKMNFPGTAEEVATGAVGRRLRGTLISSKEPSTVAREEIEASDKERVITVGTNLIQRDGGAHFSVVSINEQGLATLKSPDAPVGPLSITLYVDELVGKLAEENGPWQWG